MDPSFINELSNCLQHTVSPERETRRSAEAYLKAVELRPSYCLCLLHILQDSNVPVPTRMAAAITLKNFIKNHWHVDSDETDRIQASDRDGLRSQLIGAMLSVEGNIQSQLSEAISTIWREDFPEKWPNLIPDLVQRMAQLGADLNMVHGVLYTAHTLFKRIFDHVKLLLRMYTFNKFRFCKYVLCIQNLLVLVVGPNRIADIARLSTVLQCLLLVCKIFLSLNCQLIGNAIGFLSCVISRPQHRYLFENPETLQKLCEKVILPNMHFRDLDEELFTENPDEYIRLDLEGSNAQTRRRAACNLVHVLCEAFEGAVVTNFATYIEHLLNEYANTPNGGAWTSKDAALLLVTSVASRGKTEKHGVTVSTELVNLTTFFENHVLPELQNPNVNYLPVIKADCLRYAIAFRSLLPPMALVNLLNMTPVLLTASASVVQSYVASLIDKLLAMRRPDSHTDPLIPKEQVSEPQLLIDSLLNILNNPEYCESVYVMRALMRVCCCLQERCLPSMTSLVSTLLSRLTQVTKNPSKPDFNHFLFETICLCIRLTCATEPVLVLHFEAAFLPIFQDILQQDVVAGPKDILMPTYFRQIFMVIFRRLQSCKKEKFMKAFASFIARMVLIYSPNELITLVDGIQSNLFARVLEKVLIPYAEAIITVPLIPSTGFTKSADVSSLPSTAVCTEWRVNSIGLIRFIAEAQDLLSDGGAYRDSWLPLMTKIVTGLAAGPSRGGDVASDLAVSTAMNSMVNGFQKDERFIEIDSDPSGQSAYSQLTFAIQKLPDLCPSITDPRVYLAKTLHDLSNLSPGKLPAVLNSITEQPVTMYLQSIMERSQLRIN
ncbi:Exportin-2 [Schistosoma japonicum]|nr:Exportin-2 [Schistosoma japonicum]